MFREMRRKKQKLSKEECDRILYNGTSGVLALHGDDGYPYDEIDVMPRYVQYS